MDNSYTVIAVQDGINRTYGCETYFDAVVLADALESSSKFRRVQIWCGSLLQRDWDPTFGEYLSPTPPVIQL